MGKKDTVEKLFEDYNDVFADIVNGLLFSGKQVISQECLESTKDKSQYKADSDIHEQERDVSKRWKNGEVRIAFLGIENQTKYDKDMPLRVIGYDGAVYRSQLLSEQKERYPVITLVLYFGKERWMEHHSLLECLSVPDELLPYINDYRIHLFEIAYLSEEQIASFRSDFRVVAEYFVRSRENPEYIPELVAIQHVDMFLKLMQALTKDDRYAQVTKEMKRKTEKGGEVTMCEVLDCAEARGREKGKAEGEARLGRLIEALLKIGRVEEAKRASVDEEYRYQLYSEMCI